MCDRTFVAQPARDTVDIDRGRLHRRTDVADRLRARLGAAVDLQDFVADHLRGTTMVEREPRRGTQPLGGNLCRVCAVLPLDHSVEQTSWLVKGLGRHSSDVTRLLPRTVGLNDATSRHRSRIKKRIDSAIFGREGLIFVQTLNRDHRLSFQSKSSGLSWITS